MRDCKRDAFNSAASARGVIIKLLIERDTARAERDIARAERDNARAQLKKETPDEIPNL